VSQVSAMHFSSLFFYSTYRSYAYSSCLPIRSSAWACTCSSAALRPLPSSSLHRHLLRLLPPLNPDFPPSYLSSTRLRLQTTPTSIASAATGCSTAGSSAASLITCRVFWACRSACFFARVIHFSSHLPVIFPSDYFAGARRRRDMVRIRRSSAG
jgi:hypothetical protein